MTAISRLRMLPRIRGIALKLAQHAGLRLPLAKATKKQYDVLEAGGLGELDKSAVAELTFCDRTPDLAKAKRVKKSLGKA